MKFKSPKECAKFIQACGMVHNFCQRFNDGHDNLDVDKSIPTFDRPDQESFEDFAVYNGSFILKRK